MDNEIVIAQWLLDNATILLADYSAVSEEIDEYLYLKAIAHQQFINTMNAEDFEIAFDSERITLIIDFWFRRDSGEADSIH